MFLSFELETNCINLNNNKNKKNKQPKPKTMKTALFFALQYDADEMFLNFPASNGDDYVFPYPLSSSIKRTSVGHSMSENVKSERSKNRMG